MKRRRPPKKKMTRQEKWEAFKRALPEATALARPYRFLLLFALGMVLVNRLAGLVLPAAPKLIIDDALGDGNFDLFYIVIAAVFVAGIIQGITMFALTQTVSKAGQRMIRDLRVKLHAHVSRLPVSYFDKHRAGEASARVLNDVEGVRNLIGTGIVELVSGLLTALFVFIILLWLNWQLTVAALCFIALFAIVMIRAFSHLRPIFEERQEVYGDISGRLIESFGGVRVVKAYTTEKEEDRVFTGSADKLLKTIFKTINAIAAIGLSSSLLIGLLGVIVLFVGGHQIFLGEMTTGTFISYVLYLGFMIGPVAQAISIASSLSEAFAGLDRMREVFTIPTEFDGEEGREPLDHINGEIRFEEVSFAYEEGKPVLDAVSFIAAPGTVTALVGPSGSGKSTITNLIAGFYRAQEGKVVVDGRDLATIKLQDYRRFLGVVLQDTFLFDGSIRENIHYARPDAPEEQLQEAARIAHCLEFIETMPDKWETVIGERGVKLSGGQRQRLAIARAILADPRILILDEATSSLDSESEAAIQDGLRALMKGRTTFVIAHRLSTIRNADQILVVEDGRIIESGKHATLLASSGRYAELYNLQHGMDGRFLCAGEGAEEENDVTGTATDGKPGRGILKV